MDCFAAHGRRALRDVCETCPGFRCAPPGLNTDSNFKQQRDLRHGFAISPRVSREVWPARSALLLIGGRRECRAPDAPDSRVCNVIGRTHTRWSGHTGITRHFPRNGFNGLLRTLPGDRAFLSPSPRETWLVRARLGRPAFARLDAGVEASGPHDFTVRGRLAPEPSTGVVPIRRSPGEGVLSIVRQRALSSLTGNRPAIRRAPDAAASTASRPNVRDDGQRPSLGTGRGES